MKEHEKDRTSRLGRDDANKHTVNDGSNLVRLKDADDLKVAKKDPDVRGWPVLTADKMEVGKVDELIVDTTAMKVRYLVVDMYDDYAADKLDHYLLLPIGAARLHDKDNTVLVNGIKTTTVLNYPVYRGDTISREYEHSIRSFFEHGGIMNSAATAPVADRTAAGRTIVRTDEEHIYGHATEREKIRPEADTTPDVHGTTYRHDIESSHTHMEDPSRMDDVTRADTDTIRGTRNYEDSQRLNVGNKPLGTSNRTSPTDFNERSRTTGLTPRTGSLENKEMIEGPSGTFTDAEESGTRKTEWDAERPHRQEGEWNDTSNLNSSTSLSDETKRGSNLGNAEGRPQYLTDRERAASPERDRNDEFYKHDHFDEEVFYVRRRRKDDE